MENNNERIIYDPKLMSNTELICFRVIQNIKKFESILTDENEVCLKFASFGQSIEIEVTEISYDDPAIIYFRGFVKDQNTLLIQNISQLNFLLIATKKPNPEKPARRIGFNTPMDN